MTFDKRGLGPGGACIPHLMLLRDGINVDSGSKHRTSDTSHTKMQCAHLSMDLEF